MAADGFDPVTSTNVVLAYSYITTGDDNVAIKGGSGGKLSGPTLARDTRRASYSRIP